MAEGVRLRLLRPCCLHTAVGQEASAKEGRLSNGESSKPRTVCNLSTGEGKVQTEMAEGAKHEGIKEWKRRERGGEPGEGKGGYDTLTGGKDRAASLIDEVQLFLSSTFFSRSSSITEVQLLVQGRKNIFLHPFSFLFKNPCNKREIYKRKTNLIAYIYINSSPTKIWDSKTWPKTLITFRQRNSKFVANQQRDLSLE